jgi:hypothetical protein
MPDNRCQPPGIIGASHPHLPPVPSPSMNHIGGDGGGPSFLLKQPHWRGSLARKLFQDPVKVLTCQHVEEFGCHVCWWWVNVVCDVTVAPEVVASEIVEIDRHSLLAKLFLSG